MKITWSPLAIEQVQEIAAYIALDKPAVAVRWAEEIFDSVERLAEFSQSGRMVEEIKRKEIREIVQGNYRVIYKVMEEEILVLVVKSSRQKLRQAEIQL